MENGGGSAAALKEAAKYGVTNEIQAIIDAYTSGQPSPVILTFNGDSNVSPIEGEVVDEGLTFCNPFIGENGQPNAIYSDNTCGIDGVDNLPVFNKDISEDLESYATWVISKQSTIESETYLGGE